MLKIRKFASENLQGQVVGENISPDDERVEEATSSERESVECITSPKKNNSTVDHGPGPSGGQEFLKMRRPEGKKEEEASSSEGEYFEHITLPKNDSTEDVGQKSHPERRSVERIASLRHREHFTEETEPRSSNGQESLNMSDLGLPSSFSQQRRGQGQDKTFRCTVCKVTLTSVVSMKDHMDGKKHLKKSHSLRQKNSEHILSVVAISNPSPTRLSKVLITITTTEYPKSGISRFP